MARRNFMNAEMIALSAALIDEKRHRSAFTAIPLMAGLLSEVESAHGALLAVTEEAVPDDAERSLRELQAREKETDRTHDRKGGGVQAALASAALLAESDDEAALYERVSARLFREGGAIFSASYAAESGNAEVVAKELENPETRAVLGGIRVRKGSTLLDEARAWVKAGRALGLDESQKLALQTQLAANATGDEVAQVRSDGASARNGWIQAINAVLTNAKLLRGEHAQTFAAALHEIRTSEAKVDERASRRREAEASDGEDVKAPVAKTG